MYLTAFHLSNFCRAGEVKVELPKGREKGWHVIIGDNASGKTSILRGIAIALINKPELASLEVQKDHCIAGQSASSIVILSGEADKSFDDSHDFVQLNAVSKPLSIIQFYRQPVSETIITLPAFCKLRDPSTRYHITYYQGNGILGGNPLYFSPEDHSIYEPSEDP